jgi:hypothetical protein
MNERRHAMSLAETPKHLTMVFQAPALRKIGSSRRILILLALVFIVSFTVFLFASGHWLFAVWLGVNALVVSFFRGARSSSAV